MLEFFDETGIRLTRGDTAYIEVPLTRINEQEQDEPYTMGQYDKLRFTIKKKYKDSEIILQKIITGQNTFHFLPTDTAELPFGSYEYDIELRTASGDVFTVVTDSPFVLTAEVGWNYVD